MARASKRWLAVSTLAVLPVALLLVPSVWLIGTHVQRITGASLTKTPPAAVCGDTAFLAGPAKPPAGAVVVRAGNDLGILGYSWLPKPRTTYWFAPGVHTLGLGQYNQIGPAKGDTIIGAPGAVLDGQGYNNTAFGGTASGVTIEHLTIRNFDEQNGQNAVNHDGGADWTIEYNTIEDITQTGAPSSDPGGAALGLGNGDVVEHNCLTHNGEYGLDSVGSIGTKFAFNEVSWNGRADFPDENCGCSGGIKYWDSTNAVVEDNYIHDNYNVGLWFDTNNAGMLVTGNYIARNWAEGVVYEISYNANISGNTFLDNGWGVGSYSGPSDFPLGSGLYVNGSGGSASVDHGIYATLLVSGNVFTDNWDGVVVYQNPNRICGTSGNSSTGSCTLVSPSVFSASSCPAHISGSTPRGKPDYYDGCQWKANNVLITRNTFNFDPKDITKAKGTLPDETGSDCYAGTHNLNTTQNPPHGNAYWCGFNGMFAAEGSTAPLAGYVVADAMMGKRGSSGEPPDNNRWDDNTYNGPWAFQAYVQGTSPAVTDIYPRGVSTTLNLSGWQRFWGEDLKSR